MIVVLIIALVIFGPKRLPELGQSMGKGIREFRGLDLAARTTTTTTTTRGKPSKLAAIESAQDADEPVEGEVVTESQRS